MKKMMVILCVVAALSLVACGKGGDKDNEPTPKQEAVSEEEKNLQKDDEDIAEEIRHTVEIAYADLAVYDDLAKAIGSSTSSVEILSWGSSGITYIVDVPNLKAAIEEVYEGKVNSSAFQSTKYKSMKYVVSAKKNNGMFDITGEWK